VSPDVSKTIIPITNADVLLTNPVVQESSTTIPTGDVTTVFTVPAGERWTVLVWDAARATGDRTLDRVSVIDPVGGGVMAIARPASVNEASTVLPTPIVLDEGWGFAIRVGGGTTDGLWEVELLTLVESTF